MKPVIKLPLPPRMEKIERAISTVSGVPIEAIRGTSRDAAIVSARHAVWYATRVYAGYSLPRIGEIYDRDHTTIMNGIRRIAQSEDRINSVRAALSHHCPEIFLPEEKPTEMKTIDQWPKWKT